MKKMMTALALAAGTTLAMPAVADEAPNKLITILTAPEPQTQLMAMVLTMQAVQQGAEARIMLCGPAADIALQDAPDSATAGQPPRDMSPQGLMQGIMQAGAKVEVCAIYLPAKGVDASALLEGVTPAAPPELAGALIAPGTTVLSF